MLVLSSWGGRGVGNTWSPAIPRLCTSLLSNELARLSLNSGVPESGLQIIAEGLHQGYEEQWYPGISGPVEVLKSRSFFLPDDYLTFVQQLDLGSYLAFGCFCTSKQEE